MILTTLQNLPKNVGYLGKLIVAKGFEKLPKVQKSPNLVTLDVSLIQYVTYIVNIGMKWSIPIRNLYFI